MVVAHCVDRVDEVRAFDELLGGFGEEEGQVLVRPQTRLRN